MVMALKYLGLLIGDMEYSSSSRIIVPILYLRRILEDKIRGYFSIHEERNRACILAKQTRFWIVLNI